MENGKLENHKKIKIFDDYRLKKKLDRGVCGFCELCPNVIWMFGIFLTLQHP